MFKKEFENLLNKKPILILRPKMSTNFQVSISSPITRKSNFLQNIESNTIEDRSIKVKEIFLDSKKEIKVIINRMIRDIKNFFESEKENYYKAAQVTNDFSNNYIKYENNNDENKTLYHT